MDVHVRGKAITRNPLSVHYARVYRANLAFGNGLIFRRSENIKMKSKDTSVRFARIMAIQIDVHIHPKSEKSRKN